MDVVDLTARRARRDDAVRRVAEAPVRWVPQAFLDAVDPWGAGLLPLAAQEPPRPALRVAR